MSLSRRHFFFGSFALPVLADTKPGERPNVMLILADELPRWMLGCYGGKEVRTPNIDRLAHTGVRFLNHFAACPSPVPARASLLTGRTALQLAGGISAADVTLAKALGDSGYMCHSPEAGPSETVTGAALKFLDQQGTGKPFFLTVALAELAPPYEAAPKYKEMYAQSRFESCFPSPPPAVNANRGREMLADLLGGLRKVAAGMTAMDDRVGSFIAKLSEKGLLDSTLVVFTSNCGMLCGRHGLWASGEASDPVNMFEEAVGTPMLWRWPLRLPPQTTRPESVSACDFVPSICEVAGVAAPNRNLSGRSYLTLATGKPMPKKQPWRNVVFSHLATTDMVRDSRYKLALRDGGKAGGEFYDLQTDPREDTNGYDDARFASIRPALTAELEKWKQSYSS